jgi:competence protein ComFC
MVCVKKYISTCALKYLVKYGFDLIISLLYPSYCTHCFNDTKQSSGLCELCIQLIQPLVSHRLLVTKSYSILVCAVGAYKDPLRSLVLAKNRSNSVASRQLGQLMWDYTFLKEKSFDYLVPVPLHWRRYAWRGFNQAEEIAKEISRLSSGKIHVVSLLKRTKNTKFQSYLAGVDREKNVKNIFTLRSLKHSLYEGKHLLLVDDIMTTGATLRQAAKELKQLNPASITAIVACRTV